MRTDFLPTGANIEEPCLVNTPIILTRDEQTEAANRVLRATTNESTVERFCSVARVSGSVRCSIASVSGSLHAEEANGHYELRANIQDTVAENRKGIDIEYTYYTAHKHLSYYELRTVYALYGKEWQIVHLDELFGSLFEVIAVDANAGSMEEELFLVDGNKWAQYTEHGEEEKSHPVHVQCHSAISRDETRLNPSYEEYENQQPQQSTYCPPSTGTWGMPPPRSRSKTQKHSTRKLERASKPGWVYFGESTRKGGTKQEYEKKRAFFCTSVAPPEV